MTETEIQARREAFFEQTRDATAIEKAAAGGESA